MNSFLFTAITLCLASTCALASYQSAPVYGNGYQQQHQQQRKMAPTPQTYGSNSGYQQAMEQQSYGMEHQQQQQHYEQAAAPAYRAPSSASISQYDERVPAAAASSYNNKPAQAASSYGRQSGYSAPSTGYAKQAAPKYEEPYHPPMPFAWGYDINDGYGGAQYHKENGDEYGKRTGSYGYTDAYGIYRQVDYVADEHGFRATIKTNEPGTANESPADVELHAYEPPSNYYAGAASKESYGKQQQQSSYGAAAAAPATSSYGASSYGASSSSPSSSSYGSASYSAPRGQSYGSSSSARSSYKQQQQPSSYGSSSSSSLAQPRYEQAAQYSGSSLMPVYQKAAPKVAHPIAAAAPKRHY